MSFLEVKNLDISYPTRKETIVASKNVEFTLERGEILGIVEMKRHYTNYFKGIPHFKDYRIKMVTSDSHEEIQQLLDRIVKEFAGTY